MDTGPTAMRSVTLLLAAAGLFLAGCAGTAAAPPHTVAGQTVAAGTPVVIRGLRYDQERIPMMRKLELFGFRVVPAETPGVRYALVAAFPDHGPEDSVCTLTLYRDGQAVLGADGVSLPKQEFPEIPPGEPTPLEWRLFLSAFRLFSRRLFGDLAMPGYP